jgi:prophage DNA circulation protein
MPTKLNNGKESVANAADVAAKVSEDAKAAVEVIVNSAAKATEDAKSFLVANQEVLEKNFAAWQEFNQGYTRFVLEATQQVLNESLAFREGLDKVMIDSFKKVHVLSEQERRIVVDAAELFQDQAQAGSEYAAKMFTTASKMMTTTALFSDWAAERAAKMFTSISAD